MKNSILSILASACLLSSVTFYIGSYLASEKNGDELTILSFFAIAVLLMARGIYTLKKLFEK